MLEREVQRRLGTKSTFELRNHMRAEIIKEAALRGSDDLRRMTADDEEVDEEDGRSGVSIRRRRRRRPVRAGDRAKPADRIIHCGSEPPPSRCRRVPSGNLADSVDGLLRG